jgi:PAS domain S-box-containing protein
VHGIATLHYAVRRDRLERGNAPRAETAARYWLRATEWSYNRAVPTRNNGVLARNTEADAAREFGDAHRALIARRLPFVALGWLGLGLVMRSGLILQSALAPGPAVVSLTLQAVVFAVAIALCRTDPRAPRVLPVAFASCALLSVLSAGFYGYTGGAGEALSFALFTLGLASSLAFAWGWRVALGHLAISMVAWLAAAPHLRSFATSTERALEVAIGSCVWLGVADAAARSFRTSWYQERARRAAAQKLAESLDAYRDLAENARDLIYTHDLAGRFTYVNEAFARYVGVPAADLVGRCCLDMVPAHPSNPDLRAVIAHLEAGEAVPPQLFWVEARGGERRWLECVVSAIHGPDGVAGVRGIARDVTARKRAEDALRASEQRLRRLARHQAKIREEERKRLGFDLHDDVCQELVGIGILIESLRQQLAPQSPEADVRLGRIGRYVTEVSEHLRQLARQLRPMLLRDLGLEESLHSLAEGMTAAGTRVDARFPTVIPRLREETEIGVYRIAQEALANAARHAGAATIHLTLAVQGARLTLEISDDGAGFLPDERRSTGALGLVGMEERALALGGEFDLRSTPGCGTTVRFACPVEVRELPSIVIEGDAPPATTSATAESNAPIEWTSDLRSAKR